MNNLTKIAKKVIIEGTKTITLTAGLVVVSAIIENGTKGLNDLSITKLLEEEK